MTNKGAKRNVLHLLQAQQAPVCGQYRKCSVPKVPRHLHLVNCFQEDTLESDGPVRQCVSRFPTVSSRGRGDLGDTLNRSLPNN